MDIEPIAKSKRYQELQKLIPSKLVHKWLLSRLSSEPSATVYPIAHCGMVLGIALYISQPFFLFAYTKIVDKKITAERTKPMYTKCRREIKEQYKEEEKKRGNHPTYP